MHVDPFSHPPGLIKGHPYWLVMSGAGSEQMVVIGIGVRKNQIPFGEEDIAWMDDIAEEINTIANSRRLRVSMAETLEDNRSADLVAVDQGMETTELFSKLAYKLDPETVKCVEEGFRNLNDYSRLGKSPLASMLSIEARDHIERGKLVQKMLTDTLENLRPVGNPPSEPLPHEWYAYTILHDAYVEERLTREIMAKLYISEGTYYRFRRRALRGVTRTLLETGILNLST
jgi:hypothetical protein